MADEHINFDELEPDDPVDESHLARCERCREQHRAARLLALQAKAAPRIEAPPFFARRVTALAGSVSPPLLPLMQRVAQKMIPVLALLVLATGYLLYQASSGESWDGYAEILIEREQQVEVSLEFVVDYLGEGSDQE